MSKGRHIHKDKPAVDCPGLPINFSAYLLVPVCGIWAAHHPHAIGEQVKYR